MSAIININFPTKPVTTFKSQFYFFYIHSAVKVHFHDNVVK